MKVKTEKDKCLSKLSWAVGES